MAMTKAEKAALEAALTQAAFRRTGPVERDVLPPINSSEYVKGWDFNTYTKEVSLWWTGCVSHGSGEPPKKGTYSSGSQGARALFSTQERALRALRWTLEERGATDLRAIDRMLENASKK